MATVPPSIGSTISACCQRPPATAGISGGASTGSSPAGISGAGRRTAQALLPQGVRDGEVLHLVPARAEWPELEYDDVAEAIADGARRRGAAWSPRSTRAAALAGAGVPLAVGLLAVLAAGPG